MREPRITDDRLAARIARHESKPWGVAGQDADIALDLRDARAELARLKAEVAAMRAVVEAARRARRLHVAGSPGAAIWIDEEAGPRVMPHDEACSGCALDRALAAVDSYRAAERERKGT